MCIPAAQWIDEKLKSLTKKHSLVEPGSRTRTSASGGAVFEGRASRVTCREPGHTGGEIGIRGREKIDLENSVVIELHSREIYLRFSCSTHKINQTEACLDQIIHPITL